MRIDELAGPLSATINVTVNIIDVNDAPIISSASNFTITENTMVNTPVFQLETTDEDRAIHGQICNFYVTGGNASGVVTMDVSGLVRVARLLNFEIDAHVFAFEVSAIDTGTPQLSASGMVYIYLLVCASLYHCSSLLETGAPTCPHTLTMCRVCPPTSPPTSCWAMMFSFRTRMTPPYLRYPTQLSSSRKTGGLVVPFSL